jgi:Zn-dependent peptidase ImmA (M78 family)/transcriptional regulator with XRE-family HTH domain
MSSMNPFPNQNDESSRERDRDGGRVTAPFNSQMLVIAREARGLTQKELADLIGVVQGTISKIEDGLLIPSEELVLKFEAALGFPKHFFSIQRRIEWSQVGVGLYRRRAAIPAMILRQCEAQMNIIKMNITKLLSAAEPVENRLPCLDQEEHGGVKKVAQAIRLLFQLPPGPIRNLTDAVESAGCIIVPFDFGTRKIDACSMFVGEVPVIFVNQLLNAVRYRWTVSHELGHLIMHRIPSESDEQEEEANRFASELLMPEVEITPSLLPITIDRLARQKLKWRVSMQAILYHAKNIGVIAERQFRYYFTVINKLGYREIEPYDNDIPKEVPRLLRELIDMHLQDLSTTTHELAHELAIGETDLATWFLGRPSLRVV